MRTLKLEDFQKKEQTLQTEEQEAIKGGFVIQDDLGGF